MECVALGKSFLAGEKSRPRSAANKIERAILRYNCSM
jgi:hypothetical protein